MSDIFGICYPKIIEPVFTNKCKVVDFKKFLPDLSHFEVVASNSDINKAEIICFGDEHTSFRDDISVTDTINTLAKDGDIILVEGKPSGKEIDKNECIHTDGIKANVIVMGWDDIQLRDQSASMVRQMMDTNDKYEKAKSEGNLEEATGYGIILDKLMQSTDNIAIYQRNQCLINTIQKVKFTGKHIFIICGSNHYDEQLLVKFLSGYKYCVLIPKGSKADYNDAVRYFNGGGTSINQGDDNKSAITANITLGENYNHHNNKIITIKLSDGSLYCLGDNWFLNGRNAKVGDLIYIDPEAGTDQDREGLSVKGILVNNVYKIINIEE